MNTKLIMGRIDECIAELTRQGEKRDSSIASAQRAEVLARYWVATVEDIEAHLSKTRMHCPTDMELLSKILDRGKAAIKEGGAIRDRICWPPMGTRGSAL